MKLTEHDFANFRSPLMPFVRHILRNQGYAETQHPNMFMKKTENTLRPSFYKVSNDTVRQMCIPAAPLETHPEFITKNIRFLFSR